MKALVYDIDVGDVLHLLQHAREDKEAYLGEHALLRLQEVPDPSIPFPDWLLLRTRLCGICGSDTKQVFLDFECADSPLAPLSSLPQVMGHEIVAEVAQVGPEAGDLHPGQRVIVNPWLSCAPRGIAPPCRACREGQYPLCTNFTRGRIAPGLHLGQCRDVPGGFAPFVLVHRSMVFPIPDDVSDEAAVLADPFSVSFHSVVRNPPGEGDLVVVYGCGTLGLMAVHILDRLFEARVVAICRFGHQAELARRLGAWETVPWRPARDLIRWFADRTGAEVLAPVEGTGGLPMLLCEEGVRLIYNTVGTAESLEVSIRIAGPRARVVLSGVDTPARYEWTPHYFKEVEVVGSNAFGVESWEGSDRHAMLHYIDLLRSGRVDPTPILTHRFRIEQYTEAFRAAHEQDRSHAVKVAFDFR